MQRNQLQWIITGALLTALAVALGAFGAHALRSQVDARSLEIWKTAQLYHMIHGMGIIVVAVVSSHWESRWIRLALVGMILGILFFSGSLYFLTILPDWKWLGPITPIGGLFLILAWISLAIGAYRNWKK